MPAGHAIPPGRADASLVRAEHLRNVDAAESRRVDRLGFVLADLNFTPKYANHAAFEILNYPVIKAPVITSWTALVQRRIRSILNVERFSAQMPIASFLSGRRRYTCRPFFVESEGGASMVALLLERRARDLAELPECTQRFHLSPRECETVRHLIHGLSTKEIAQRMSVSPNTVKQFVRLIMGKMGVTNRLGIIAQLHGG